MRASRVDNRQTMNPFKRPPPPHPHDDPRYPVRKADAEYSKELGINESIRNTTLKPSGTKSKMDDVDGEGIHAGLRRLAGRGKPPAGLSGDQLAAITVAVGAK